MVKKFSLLLLTICYSIIAIGSNFKSLTTLNGLSQNDVNCIFQDSRGFIWIGTHDGLNRYDGYSFKVYRMQPGEENGLVSNIVFTITEDKEANLWIGSSDNGICKFDVDNNKYTHFSNSTENPKVLTSNRIIQIFADSYNNIWSLTNEGADVINVATNEVKHISIVDLGWEGAHLPGNFCRCIYEDSSGDVWIGTFKGLAKVDPITHKVSHKYVPKMRPSLVNNIQEYGNNLVVSNGTVLRVFDKEKKEYQKSLRFNRLTRMLIDDIGNLWLGSASGIYLSTISQETPLQYTHQQTYTANKNEGGLTTNYITALCKDNSGQIWIGTNGGGINIYNPQDKPFKFYDIRENELSASYNKVRSVYEDSNSNLWVGTVEGLNLISGAALEEQTLNSKIKMDKVTDNLIYSIAEDKQSNRLWMGAMYPDVLHIYNTKTQQSIDPTSLGVPKTKPIFSVLVDSKGTVWLGTYGDGLWRLKKKTDGTYYRKQFVMEDKSYALSSNIIRSLFEDKQGNIWVGTSNGLNKISYKECQTKNPRFFVHKNIPGNEKTISHNYILPIFQSSNGDIWIGTMGGGLNRHVISDIGIEYFEAITTEDGLPNNVIKGILEDEDNNLWISSNSGLTCYNPSTKKIRNYDVADGLQDNEFSELAYCKAKDGSLIFGGVNGINIFNPSTIEDDNTVGELAFTQLDILNQPINVGEEIGGRVLLQKDINATKELKLKYEENSFTLYFAGLHFVASHKNKYKYMLEGFDKEWISTNSDARFAKYTNLKPGDYTLKVMASNSDGLWNEAQRSIHITVIAPWWLSKMAMLAYVIVIVLLLWFFRRFTLIGVQQKGQLLMERFEKEKVEELAQMKLKFFTNISHEFRTPLTLILGPIEKIIKEKNNLGEAKVDQIHQTIYRNTNVLLRLINQLMDFRKYEQGKMKMEAAEADVVAFVKGVSKSFDMIAEEKNIDFSFTCSSQSVLLWFDADKLEKIIYNLLSNAFKYTEPKGSITVILNEYDKNINIEVKDTGIGMSKNTTKHVFERFYNLGKQENRMHGSTGIGLSYCKSLVEMHHGLIKVQSKEGVGTSFIVELQKGNKHFKKDEIGMQSAVKVQTEFIPQPITVPVSNPVVTPDTPNDDRQLKILVVEDNFELRQYITDSLREFYTVIDAQNGEEGIQRCIEHHPDLVISDVMMPQKDGFELCKEIKENVAISHIPVILLTAKSSGEYKIKGYELGADAYVSKPFEFNVLKAQIDNLIKNRKDLIAKYDNKIDISPTEIATTSTDEKFLTKIVAIIEENIDNSEFTVEELASDYGISKVILNRKLKALTGKTAKIFIRTIRLKRAAQLLSLGRYTVAEVTYEVGFSDLKYFRTCFKSEFSLSPSEYKKKHSDQPDDAAEEPEDDKGN